MNSASWLTWQHKWGCFDAGFRAAIISHAREISYTADTKTEQTRCLDWIRGKRVHENREPKSMKSLKDSEESKRITEKRERHLKGVNSIENL